MYSVVIPAFNVENFLQKCVESVAYQPNGENIEIIIIDDGSTDSTPSLADTLSKQHKNVKVIHQTNRGLSCARNRGIEEASGDYVVFLDSDDFWSDDVFLKIDQQITEQEPDFLVFSMNSFYENNEKQPFLTITREMENKGRVNKEEALTLFLENNYSYGWCSVCYVIKKKILFDKKIKFPAGRLCEDVNFTYKLWANSSTVSFSSAYLYNYRREHKDSISHTASFKFSSDLLFFAKGNLLDSVERYPRKTTVGVLLKLNAQSLIGVVLYHYSSYSRAERKELVSALKHMRLAYDIPSELSYLVKRKEKIVSRLVRVFGFSFVGNVWGIKRKKQAKKD